MKLNIVHILVIVLISGVIGLNNTKLSMSDVDPIIINGKNASDVPAVTTVNSINISTPVPTNTPPEPTPLTTTLPPSTVPPTTTTTTPATTTTTTIPTTTIITTDKPTTTTTTPKPDPTTAPPSNVTSTTASTTTTTTAAPAHKGRHFDGPSFIGGIILASGLMAIGFVSWKFYKARTERNYHTL